MEGGGGGGGKRVKKSIEEGKAGTGRVNRRNRR